MEKNPQNVYSLKNSNRARILECVRHQPISRADISRQLGLTKSAVTTLANEMIREGLLFEAGPAEKSTAPGRTSILLDIVPSYAFAAGVTLHRRFISVCLTDLKAHSPVSVQMPLESFASPDMALDWIEQSIQRLMRQAGLPAQRCVGIGVSSPGPLDHAGGEILEPPGFSLFHHYPIVNRLRRHFDCPVFLENNAVSLALTDFWRRGGTLGNTLFVIVTDGIGSALLQDGRVFRGSQGYAGELGHISVDPQGDRCSCGNRGCLERYASLEAMKARFDFEEYREIVDRAEQGDNTANAILQDLVTHMGMALVGSVNLFDLESIVIFGEYAYRAEILTKQIEQYIRRHSLICRAHPVSVLPSVLTLEDAHAASAISALNAFFEQTK